jgi:hypothetical protein
VLSAGAAVWLSVVAALDPQPARAVADIATQSASAVTFLNFIAFSSYTPHLFGVSCSFDNIIIKCKRATVYIKVLRIISFF